MSYIKVMHMNACDMCGVHIHQVQSNYFTGLLLFSCDCSCIPLQQKKNNWALIFDKIARNKQYSMLKASLMPISLPSPFSENLVRNSSVKRKLRIIVHFQRNSEYVSPKQFVLWVQSSMYSPLSRDTVMSHPEVPGFPCSVDHPQEGCHVCAWIYGNSNRDTKASHWLASGPDL